VVSHRGGVKTDADQERISKLIDIWLGSKTFAPDMLNSFKQRLSTSPQGNTNNTALLPSDKRSAADIAAANGAQIKPTSTPTNGQAYAQPAAATPTSVSMAKTVGTPSTMSQSQFQAPNPGAAAQALAAMQGLPINVQNGNAQPQPPPMMPFLPPQSAVVAPPPSVAGQNLAAVAQNAQAPSFPALNSTQLQAIQAVVQANPSITPEQLISILAAMGVNVPATPAIPGQVPPAAAPTTAPVAPPQNQYGPPGQDQQSYQRDRSRSPDHKRRRVTPPNRRESPTYGVYDPSAAKSEISRGNDYDRRDRGRGKGRDNYRKRSPPRERLASPGMMGRSVQGYPSSTPKPFGHDPSLPNGQIRGIIDLFVWEIHAHSSSSS
jgi:protein NRD1